MTRQRIPDEVLSAAHARSQARADRDWARADELRAEIEAAGWKVVDRGTDFALTPVAAPDVEDGGTTRYGSSAVRPVAARCAIHRRGDDRPDRHGLAGRPRTRAAPASAPMPVPGRASSSSPTDRRRSRPTPWRRCKGLPPRTPPWRSSGPGRGSATGPSLNIGIRRATGAVVIVLDTSVEPTGDVVTPLVAGARRPDRRGRRRVRDRLGRPPHVPRRPAGRRRRDRGLRAGVPSRRLSRRAARSTSGSASTATSTSGGAWCCATRGRGSRRAARSRSTACRSSVTSTAAGRASRTRSATARASATSTGSSTASAPAATCLVSPN